MTTGSNNVFSIYVQPVTEYIRTASNRWGGLVKGRRAVFVVEYPNAVPRYNAFLFHQVCFNQSRVMI